MKDVGIEYQTVLGCPPVEFVHLTHVVRSGSTAADLAALDASLFGYVQLGDHALEQRNEVYRDDSSDRGVPGEGELPLVEILLALPAWLPVGVEAPMRTRAAQGMSASECAGLAVAGARGVLAEVRAEREKRG